MITKTFAIAAVAIIALFATSALHAQIFNITGPDAPLVLFDAEDYNATTGHWPNIGTGGAANDAYGFDDPVWGGAYDLLSLSGNVGGIGIVGAPDKQDNFFAGTHAAATFDNWGTVDGAGGEGLLFNDTGLPKATNREMTFFAVLQWGGDGDRWGGVFGHGKVNVGEAGTNEQDNLALWYSPSFAEPNPHEIQLHTDASGCCAAAADSGLGWTAGETHVVSMTVQADDAVRFAFREDGGALQTIGAIASIYDLDSTDANLGYIGFGPYFFKPRFMDGGIGMLAIVPGAMSDTKRDTIINALYERYINGGNEPLIIPEPATVFLVFPAVCSLLLTYDRRRRRTLTFHR